jgi:hypothetical protein
MNRLFLSLMPLVILASCSKDVAINSSTGHTIPDIAERQFEDNTLKSRPVADIVPSDYYFWGQYWPLVINPTYDIAPPVSLENLSFDADSNGFLVSAIDTTTGIFYDAVEFDTLFQSANYLSVIILDGPVGPNLVYADLGKRIFGKTIIQKRYQTDCEEYGILTLRGTSYDGSQEIDYDPFTDDRGRLYNSAILNTQVEFIPFNDTLPRVFGDCIGYVRNELPADSITGEGTLNADCRYNDPFFSAVCLGPEYSYLGITNIRVISDMNSSFALRPFGIIDTDCRDLGGATNKQVWFVQGVDPQGDPVNIPIYNVFKELRFYVNGGDDSIRVSNDCD